MAVALIVISILFSVFVAIRPFNIGKVPINMATAPLVALVGLLVLGVIDFDTVQFGIFGNGQLVPWEIIVIFFTVAYVSISTDVTGIFDYFAYKIVHAANKNGIALFVFFYLFACALTIFTSNDIVILTLTPIIFYLSKHAKVNVVPLLFAEFFGANTLSTLLYIGNPTNIIVGNALGLGFLEFTQIMWLPTLVAAVANLALLALIFRKDMTKRFSLNENSTFNVQNWPDAILSLVLLLLMLATLVSSQSIGLPIWFVTLVFSIMLIIEDLAFGMALKKDQFWTTFKRIPWKILPFVFVFFIFMQGLNHYGVVDQIASLIAHYSQTLASGIAINGFLALILANLVNNQPMTILYSGVLVSDSFLVSDTIFQGSAYAVVMASNLGANITLIGALAGLMWNKILKTKGLEINYLDFLKKGIVITPIVFSLSLVALYLVLV